MFDIGFWELAIIGLVALLVIGPERLPSVARHVGKWVGRTRSFVSQVRQDIDRELQQEELKKALQDDSGLGEIKQIMETDQHLIEDEVQNIESAASSEPDTAPDVDSSAAEEPRVDEQAK